ncbi:MAG: J domain-containing protein [Spirochaetota bacterium]
MDIFDRLGNLIRTIIDDEDGPHPSGARFDDPDEAAAWDELEAYMNSGASGEAPSFEAPDRGGMPESLRRDFRNLEVPAGAPLPDVRRAYKRLMAAYHPDRHSSDREKLRTATEITKKLNQSFQRIRTYYEGSARAHDSSA